MIKITYFVHGTTIDNENRIASGWSDAMLSEKGIEQAKKVREIVADRKFDIVFCSDLRRAHDSAKIIFGDRVEIIPDKRLRECSYGKLNGGSSDTVEPLQEKMIFERFPEGESYEDVKSRMAEFIKFLKANYDGKSVAIVAHKAPQLSLDVLIKGKTWEQAFAEDWRKTKAWQPGWEYIMG